MSQMEIDIPSASSFRVGQKRARSPASPPLDRPSKRASGSAGRTPSPLDIQQQRVHKNPDTHQLPCAYRDCRTPDDWVVKTGGLKLDSPSFGLGHAPLPEPERRNVDSTAENTVNDTHEVMMTDHDVAMEAWPFPSARNRGSPPFHPLPSAAHAAASLTQCSDIHIHIHPATPSNPGLAHSSMIQSGYSSRSATNSGAWSSPSTPTKKPRVTMGPRPDCEKCRMGIKGHWMHVD